MFFNKWWELLGGSKTTSNIRISGILLLLVLGLGCTATSKIPSEDKPRIEYNPSDEITIGEEGYEAKLLIDKAVVREVSIPIGEAREYSVDGFNYYVSESSGKEGVFLFVKVTVEGVGYKATSLPRPYLILIDKYGEEIRKGGTSPIPVEYKKKKDVMLEYPLIKQTEFIDSARLQIETEREIIVVPLEIKTLLESKRSVDYLELPEYCYLLGPSSDANGIYLDIAGKSSSQGEITPDDIYKWIAGCLNSIDINVEIDGDFPDGNLCYEGNCIKMYQYEKENITIPDVLKNREDIVLAKNSFCWDLRALEPKAACSVTSGHHLVSVR